MDVFQRVRSDYVDKVDDETLIKGAINGMLSSLDPHSSFLDARDFENLRTQTDGAYGGLGLSVTMEDGAVKVIAPTNGTPADRAGIKAGDYLRSEERSVGKECVSTCRSRWSQYHKNKKPTTNQEKNKNNK